MNSRRILRTAAVCLLLAQVLSAQKPSTESYLQILARAEAKTKSKEWVEAALAWENVVEVNPINGRFWSQLASARYHNKDYRKAIAAYEKVLDLRQGFPSSAAYNIASCYALLGEKEQALKWLEKAFDMGYRYLEDAQTDGDLESLHEDSRFRSLVGLIDTGKMSRDEGSSESDLRRRANGRETKFSWR